MSASKNVNAPKNAENGISILWLLPTKILPICGTINPRKLIAPATAVEILASKTATSEITILVTLTFTPKLLAVLSSRDNRLHSCVNNIARNNPATTYGSNVVTSSHVFCVIFASTIAATPVLSPPDIEFKALDNPVNKLFTATPVKIILIGLKPPFHDKQYTMKNATTPPANAAIGVKKYSVGANAVIMTAVKLAPLEIPIIPGSASGFFNTAWNNTPETAMAAPANIEMMIRGKRRS